MLRLTKLTLRNIRSFPKLDINFSDSPDCVLLIGDNGDGKSTVLRSLAMGLCDQSSASALFRELPGEFVRRGNENEQAFIEVELAASGGWRYRIRTDFIALESFERIEQTHYRTQGKGPFRKISQDNFPWSQMFVSGYGAGIRTSGNADYSYYLPVDAVYPLFRYDAMLQNPELAIRRLVDEASRRNQKKGELTLDRLKRMLSHILNLKSIRDIELDRRGIFVIGPWGREELSALGDGYRATTTWILDLISWWLLYTEEPLSDFNSKNLFGIVIIDEIEQHLHPRWQRTILPQLRKAFPKVQFVVATHSPLVASSSPDLAVHRFDRGEHSIHKPFGWRAEDVYDMMGVPTSRADAFERQILSEFKKLELKRLHKSLSDSERDQLNQLRAQLAKLPPGDPARVTIELNTMLKSLSKSAKS